MYISPFQELKTYIVEMTNFARDALHIHAGLAIFFVVAFLHRRNLKSPVAILVTLIVAIGAESIDARDDFINYGYWRLDDSLKDVFNTTFWPLVIWSMAHLNVWVNRVKNPQYSPKMSNQSGSNKSAPQLKVERSKKNKPKFKG